MAVEMCKHKRQLTVCAECAPEAERTGVGTLARFDPTDTHDETGIRKPTSRGAIIRRPTSGGDTKFRLALVKRSNDDPIPEDEPIFILRARDHLAVSLLRGYYTLCVEDGCNDHQLAGADAVLRRFESFAATHPKRMKQPGVTRGR